MGSRPTPLHAADATAAALMDMKTADFLAHVNAGHLPSGKEIAPGVIRWDVDELRSIAKGELARPDQGLAL